MDPEASTKDDQGSRPTGQLLGPDIPLLDHDFAVGLTGAAALLIGGGSPQGGIHRNTAGLPCGDDGFDIAAPVFGNDQALATGLALAAEGLGKQQQGGIQYYPFGIKYEFFGQARGRFVGLIGVLVFVLRIVVFVLLIPILLGVVLILGRRRWWSSIKTFCIRWLWIMSRIAPPPGES